MTTRHLFSFAFCACTGGGSSGSFKAATPPADVCSLLALSDAKAIIADAQAGSAQQGPPDTADYWSRDCKWASLADGTKAMELVVFGAKTESGAAMVKLAAASGSVNTPVSGLGDEAHYWEQGTSDNGLWALSGSVSVDVTVYFLSPFPTADQLKPLVAKALGALH